jgi:hypothetical protein
VAYAGQEAQKSREDKENVNETKYGGQRVVVRSNCVRWSGGIRRGMRGMCGPFGGEWAQEKRFCPFARKPRAGLGGVCAQRETQDLLVVSY